jgi:AMP deaminase
MQIPRLYNVYKAQGLLSSFAELLANVFAPLFEVTLDPGSHPQVRSSGGGRGLA